MNMTYIGDAFEFVRNGASIKQSENASGIPITRIETIWNSTIDSERFGYANIIDSSEYENYLLKDGDILMSHINSPKHLGKCACYQNKPDKLIHGMNLLSLRPNKDYVFSKFIYYFFNTSIFKGMINKISNQSVNQASFSAGNLKKLKIPLPPLAEQKQIATILDAADSLRQKDQQLVEHYTALSQSLFLEMFGDFIENPKGFEQGLLGDVLCEKNSIKCGPFGSQLKIGEFVETGIPVYGIDNVQINRFVNAKPKYITEEKFKELSAFHVSKNDLLISRTGTVGRACLAPEVDKAVIGPNLLKVRIQNSRFNPRFLTFAFNYSNSIINQIKMFSPGATVAVYNTGNLKKLRILIPPLKLQNQFAKYIALLERQKQQAQSNLQKSEALFNSLLQRAFTGELTADRAA